MLTQAINNAKLEYISDIEWNYTYEDKKVCVMFYKDENGHNHVEQFLQSHHGVWVEVLPTDEQLQLMYKILNDTPYRENIEESFREEDNYDNTGTTPANFY